MDVFCTRPNCTSPNNNYPDLDKQRFCTGCGMPLILGGHYLPIQLLGRGGFGAAFLARDRDTPSMRYCVVKQFLPPEDLSPAALEIARKLFAREAEVLEKLGDKHEQIPKLFAFFSLTVNNPKTGKEDEFFYLVQQYIDGENLEEELNVKGSFSEAEVRYVLEEMLKILQFVHENGSIHRDIKPSNIMRYKTNRLYLLDFGAVKQVTLAGGQGTRSIYSTGIYTPGYAPPEQMQGSQVYPCTDLYALAATCLHLLTGKRPEELYDPFNNSWHWQTFAPSTSSQLTEVLNKMLQATPKDRPQSAAEVQQKLKEIPAVPDKPTSKGIRGRILALPKWLLIGILIAVGAFTIVEGPIIRLILFKECQGCTFYWANLSGADLSRVNLRKANLNGANLSKTDLSNANLISTNLNGANLNGANLSKTDLSNANLSKANLISTNLKNADLNGTNLSSADLSDTNLSKANLGGADLISANLSKANLSQANLTKANLTKANLSQANLINADLSWANLSQANLSNAYLNKANLRFANLSKTDLSKADLNGSNLSGADLRGTELSGADLRGTDLNSVNLRGADMNSTNLNGANLSGANLSEANLSGANLSGANLSEANLNVANLNVANLSGADLSGADLSGANLSGANLSKANLSNGNASYISTNLRKANLSGANLSGANLSEANLSGADLDGADLTGANLTGAKLGGE